MKLRKIVVDISPVYEKELKRWDLIQDICVITMAFFSLAPLFALRIFEYPTTLFYYALILSPFCVVAVAFVYMFARFEFAKRKNILVDEYSALLTKFGTEALIFELMASWWEGIKERIKQVYPEVPETNVSKFISDWLDVATKIRQRFSDRPETMRLHLDIAWKRLMEAHQIPLIFNIHKSENIGGGAFFILSFRRPDSDERAFLEALRQSIRIYATSEPRAET